MGSKTRLGSYCTKRANNGVNLVTSRNINTRLARPICKSIRSFCNAIEFDLICNLTERDCHNLESKLILLNLYLFKFDKCLFIWNKKYKNNCIIHSVGSFFMKKVSCLFFL